MKYEKEQALLLGMCSPDSRERRRVTEEIYVGAYPIASRFVLQNNGSEAEARDTFQDAMVILYQQCCRGDFQLSCALSTYMYSLCRNLWLKQLRRQKFRGEVEDMEDFVEPAGDPESFLAKQEESNLLQAAVRSLGEECRQILTSFYFRRLRVRDIQSEMGLVSEQVVKNKKSKCMARLRSRWQQTI